MQKKTKSLIWVAAALLVAVVVGWLSAQSDDRPPIIVSNGSMYFTNGDASSSILPTQWTDDTILNEWKPADNGYRGIRGFAVTFENSYVADSVCPDASTMPPKAQLVGDDVKIEYTLGSTPVRPGAKHAAATTMTFDVKRRRDHLIGAFGKYEPKVTDPGKNLQNPTSTRLEFNDPTTDGYISKVTVGNTVCQFPQPPQEKRLLFRVRIQPKAD